ncbi:MAG: hypothetical protein ABR535_01200 [Pyrinomonadaceae bacterium]
MVEVFQLTSELLKRGILDLKVAFVDRFVEHDEVNQFGAWVAANCGAAATIFAGIEEAERWLLDE